MFGYSRSYASLEQIQGTGTDPRSDLYSLAATLYHLLTGVPPADALTRAMNVLSEKDDPLVPLDTINRDIPASIAEVLQKAMALNANQRPISCFPRVPCRYGSLVRTVISLRVYPPCLLTSVWMS